MDRIIITVVGKDRKGIIARVTTLLYEADINILDISQTIVAGFFNMMVVADPTASPLSFAEIDDRLTKLGEGMGLKIQTQREAIFTAMHRV